MEEEILEEKGEDDRRQQAEGIGAAGERRDRRAVGIEGRRRRHRMARQGGR